MTHTLYLSRFAAILLVPVLVLMIVYLVVFGRALQQDENHLGVALALPRLMLGADAVPIDKAKFLSKDASHFVKAMERLGFVYTDQEGAGYIFQKNGRTYMSGSRMYSSHYMIFTYPGKF